MRYAIRDMPYAIRPPPVQSTRILLAQLIDYAGLFPPAQLEMGPAVERYAEYRAGPDAWALGRFVVPAVRLEVFERAAEPHLPRDAGAEPWRVSVLASPDVGPELARVLEFNARHADGRAGAAVVDTIEIRVDSGDEVERAMLMLAGQVTPYFEVPIARDPGHLVAAIARTGARAKVRTGGVTPADIPAPRDLLRFLRLCVGAGVPFKATAGLHHPLRASYPLTYEPGCEEATMFGFLNVWMTAALLRAGIPAAEAPRVLEETELAAFSFENDAISWRGHRVDTAALADLRQRIAVSLGSCSFREPIDEMKALGLL